MEKKYHRLENLDRIITEKIEGEPKPIPTNCMDCKHHQVLPDPDLEDEFCSDDEKVLCNFAKVFVTTKCRPHHKRNECKVPSWCPLM